VPTKKSARSSPVFGLPRYLLHASPPKISTAPIFSPQIQFSILDHRRCHSPPPPLSHTLRPTSPTSRLVECRPPPSSIRPKSQLPKPPLPHSPSPSTAATGVLLFSPPRCRLEVRRWPPPSSFLFSNHQYQGLFLCS
jgi:hypothetical protein